MKKNKAFLAVGNYDSNVGYAWRLMESFWCAIAEQLRPLGYQAHVVFPSVSIVPMCLSQAGFSVRLHDFTKRDPLSILRQSYFLWSHNIQFLYLTDFKTYSAAYFFYRLAGVRKIVSHDHTPGLRTIPSPFRLRIKQFLNGIKWLSVDACFAVSPYVSQRLVSVNGVHPDKVFCITNGIPVQDSPSVKVPHEGIRIVTVARAHYYKGIDFAIKVMAVLLKNNPSLLLSYTLFGDGPNIDEFKQLAESLGVSKSVHFAGRVDDVVNRLLAADIAFHPSLGEAMSLALLECMRAQLAVVVSSNPSVSSFLINNQTALIYEEGSVTSAADAIQRLINDSLMCDELGQNAWRAVKNQFNDVLMYENLKNSVARII